MRFASLLLIASATLSCAHAKDKASTRCPESQDQRCLFGQGRCSMDRNRGCEVCACDPGVIPQQGSDGLPALPSNGASSAEPPPR
jgi:hypothetical protein